MVHSRHSLLVGLVMTTFVVTVALSWAGWRLLNLQRDLDERRVALLLEATADSMVADIRRKLAETGEKLSAGLANPLQPSVITDAVVLTMQPDGSAIAASGGLPFVPKVPASSVDDAIFAEAKTLEIFQTDLAADRYRLLAGHSDPAIRAGAWLGLGRVAIRRGDPQAALRAYRQLAQLGDVRVEQLPASFIGLYQQRAIAGGEDGVVERQLTTSLIDGLDTGKWLLTGGQAGHYIEQLGSAEPDTWPLATAIDRLWGSASSTFPLRGQRVFSDGSRSVLVMWRGGTSGTAVMASFLDKFLPSAPVDTRWQLTGPEEEWIAGERTVPAGAAAALTGDAEFPWTLRVASIAPAPAARNETTLIAMMAAMLVFLWGAMYFMARAIRREAAVARLQSDFVAAVSHEFRSPLTTIRQMTEMLEIGRVPDEERRQAYYRMLTSEATRLQRLVETLLNFGRMDEGAARYRLEETDLAALVRRVAAEIEPAARIEGKRIEMAGFGSSVRIRADANALALAVRNILENAIKYSPGQAAVRVELRQGVDHVDVCVIDQGIGIPRSEQRTIFDKFVRGRAAIDANVSGTGVGLAMVRQIALAHAGHVTVESEVGQGSTFSLVLPLADSELSDANRLRQGSADESGEASAAADSPEAVHP